MSQAYFQNVYSTISHTFNRRSANTRTWTSVPLSSMAAVFRATGRDHQKSTSAHCTTLNQAGHQRRRRVAVYLIQALFDFTAAFASKNNNWITDWYWYFSSKILWVARYENVLLDSKFLWREIPYKKFTIVIFWISQQSRDFYSS